MWDLSSLSSESTRVLTYEPPGNSVDTPVLYCSCLETGHGDRTCLLGDTADFLVSTEYIQDEPGVS